MTMEMILIALIMTSVSVAFLKTARNKGWAQAYIEGPWAHIQGMIEDGVWVPAGDKSKALNPNLLKRHGAFNGTVL
jgi:lysophospholipid acyltransferase (LPLAT)-like uncharacterized protein